MELIATTTLASAQGSITFSGIPQYFDDLFVLVSARSSLSGGGFEATLSLNGSGSNRRRIRMRTDGFSITGADTTDADIMYTPGTQVTADTFSNTSIYIPNYRSGNFKSANSDSAVSNNGTEFYLAIYSWLWSETAAITGLTLTAAGNFIAGSSVSLYGITKGSDGIVTTS
jgi:hypothetical protein